MRVVARETSRRDQTSLRPNPVHCVQMKTIPKIAGSCCTRPRLSGTHQPRQGCRRLKTSMKSKTARRKCRKHPQKAQNVQNTHLNVQKCRLFTPTRPKRLTLRRSGYSIFSTTPLDAEARLFECPADKGHGPTFPVTDTVYRDVGNSYPYNRVSAGPPKKICETGSITTPKPISGAIHAVPDKDQRGTM